jgi:hypothetical protein
MGPCLLMSLIAAVAPPDSRTAGLSIRRQLPHELTRLRRLVRPDHHAGHAGQREDAGVLSDRDADLAVRHRPGDLLQR